MSCVLTLVCDNGECTSGPDRKPAMVHGEEAAEIRDPHGSERVSTVGHTVLEYGVGLLKDLYQAALAAGWHWDGSEWTCPKCTRKGIMRGWVRPEEVVAK